MQFCCLCHLNKVSTNPGYMQFCCLCHLNKVSTNPSCSRMDQHTGTFIWSCKQSQGIPRCCCASWYGSCTYRIKLLWDRKDLVSWDQNLSRVSAKHCKSIDKITN